MKKTAALLFALLTLGACASTEPNEVGLHYDRGPIEGRGFNSVVNPNTSNKAVGPSDQVFTYRIDQRSWIGRSNDDGGIPEGVDRGAVEFVSKDGLRMRAPFELYFTLNQEPDVLRRFHEEIGLKTQAWSEDGWRAMLREYMDPQLERAIDSAGLRHDWRPLRENEDIRTEFASDAERRFTSNLEDVIGGNYFCSPRYQKPGDTCGEVIFTIGQPSPVDVNVVRAIESEQTRRAETQALSAERERAEAEASARQVLIDQVGPEVYACLEAIDAARAANAAPPPCLASSGANPVVDVNQ